MKKYLISVLAVLVLLILGAFLSILSKQSSYYKTISATSSSVLVLENFDKSNVKIVTGDTDEITVDLEGSDEDLANIVLDEDGIFAKFGISAEFSSLSGTIVVPEGTLIDVMLSEGRTIEINDLNGSQEISDSSSFLVDTNTLNSFAFSSSGTVILDSWGDLIVWDDETWAPLDENNGGGEQDDSEPIIYCGIGSQAIRNYCCETKNTETDTPTCDGISYWIFDNVARDCAFVCEVDETEEAEEENIDCSVGGQAERDVCCSDQHIGEYQGCIGVWRYNSAAQACRFYCDLTGGLMDPVNDPEEDEEESVSFGDPVSDYCWTMLNEEDQDLCCNDTLKNSLSSGPRLGFPDCIGKWYFDDESGCAFECADYVEMQGIINEIRQNAQD